MVNPDSPTFQFFEKTGLIVGKVIRFVIVGSIIAFLGGKLSGSRPSQPTPNPPGPTPPQS